MIDAVSVFVLATATSGPQRVSTKPSATRVVCAPGVLQIVICGAPRRLASAIASSVSTVSPDCATEIDERVRPDQRVAVAELRRVVDLRRYAGDALEVRAADHRRVHARAHADEHDARDRAQRVVAEAAASSSSTPGGSKMARPRNVSMMHSGCSMISLSMKCLYAPFAAETGSNGTVCGCLRRAARPSKSTY